MTRPSLRTVRAVFPHTALQSVVYTSGLASSSSLQMVTQSQVSKFSIWLATICPLRHRYQCRQHKLLTLSAICQSHWLTAGSACLAFSGTVTVSFIFPRSLSFAYPLPCHPWLMRLSYSTLLMSLSLRFRHQGLSPRFYRQTLQICATPFPVCHWP